MHNLHFSNIYIQYIRTHGGNLLHSETQFGYLNNMLLKYNMLLK